MKITPARILTILIIPVLSLSMSNTYRKTSLLLSNANTLASLSILKSLYSLGILESLTRLVFYFGPPVFTPVVT